MTIWKQKSWPNFSFDSSEVENKLQSIQKKQSTLITEVNALPKGIDKEAELDALLQSAIKTSAIEGDKLNVESVRSSVANHLNLTHSGLPKAGKHEAAIVDLLSSAINDLETPLDLETLCQWQSKIFTEPPIINKIIIGKLRDDALGAMQVISSQRGKTVVHYQAPPAKTLTNELSKFLDFYNQNTPYNGVIKAAVAHLYFISIHPFDDGNGRIARALTDRVLAHTEHTSIRFYSLSAAIEKNKDSYYQILEQIQNCQTSTQNDNPLDITEWLHWFLDVLLQAIDNAFLSIDRVIKKAEFWQQHAQTVLSERQIKVLNRLLDSLENEFTNGIAARHYKRIANVSKATATRDLSNLLNKNCIQQSDSGGRSVRYRIKF